MRSSAAGLLTVRRPARHSVSASVSKEYGGWFSAVDVHAHLYNFLSKASDAANADRDPNSMTLHTTLSFFMYAFSDDWRDLDTYHM